MYAHEHAKKAANMIKVAEEDYMRQGFVDNRLIFLTQIAQVHATLAASGVNTD